MESITSLGDRNLIDEATKGYSGYWPEIQRILTGYAQEIRG
jgi:hypothetical protein